MNLDGVCAMINKPYLVSYILLQQHKLFAIYCNRDIISKAVFPVPLIIGFNAVLFSVPLQLVNRYQSAVDLCVAKFQQRGPYKVLVERSFLGPLQRVAESKAKSQAAREPRAKTSDLR